MICKKCSAVIDNDSKFCSKCGAKVEQESSLDSLIEVCQRLWYILGFMNGASPNDKELLEKFNIVIKRIDPDFYEKYLEIIKFWKDKSR